MKKPTLLLAGFFSLMVGVAFAQPAAQPDMANLFQKVNEVAQQLQANLGDLEADIQASRDSIEKGGEVLDEMLASVTKVNESMAEESEIWQELDALLALWEQRRQETLKKSEANPAFLPVAQSWQAKLDTGRELRNQISTERANSVALMRSIESDRDIVLAYYELGQADKAIEGLKKVGANLTNLNANMQAIVKTANEAQQTPISQ
ncbi:hypothetical protein [Thiocystis violascens]|uniref:Uncharacterized protein n=1 Tax=Thiocystis violascens (strain ATCC 17096 / DSM 198 / 6111) TaxID=765911 RepID=I3YFF1_THIV6|nr:hypothetical protein [Thiocystis violascens]AFL75719.1 hypothetical protein Thivi_3879 [Thiocystis violascens DSM 198]